MIADVIMWVTAMKSGLDAQIALLITPTSVTKTIG